MFCFHKLRKHYKEYLIFKVNEAQLDPGDDMEVDELRAVIMREEKAIPEGDEKDAQYKERLKEVSNGSMSVHGSGGQVWLSDGVIASR